MATNYLSPRDFASILATPFPAKPPSPRALVSYHTPHSNGAQVHEVEIHEHTSNYVNVYIHSKEMKFELHVIITRALARESHVHKMGLRLSSGYGRMSGAMVYATLTRHGHILFTEKNTCYEIDIALPLEVWNALL